MTLTTHANQQQCLDLGFLHVACKCNPICADQQETPDLVFFQSQDWKVRSTHQGSGPWTSPWQWSLWAGSPAAWQSHHLPLTIAQWCITYHWQLLNDASHTTDNCSTMHHLPLTVAQQSITYYWQLLNIASFTIDNCSTMHLLPLTIAQQCIIYHWQLLSNA